MTNGVMKRLLVFLVLAGCAGAIVARAPGGGAGKPPFVQVGNHAPVRLLSTRDARSLPDNLMGTGLGSFDPGYANSGVVYPVGFKWVHLSFADDVLNWQNVERTPGVYSVDPGADRAISDYAANGTSVILCLGVGEAPPRPTLGTREQVDAYLGYVRFMVAHFKGRVSYYEILNEPDTMLTAERYVDVVERAIPLIRAEDPAAKIVIGAGAGVWRYDYPGYGGHGRYSMNLGYLKAVFGSHVAARVDVLTWHGMYGSRADDPYYRGYARTVAGLISVARAGGFSGRFLAGEMHWPRTVDPPQDNNMLQLPERQAVKYFLRTSVLHRGLGLITVIAPTGVHRPDRPISKALRALNNLLAGAEPAPLARSVQTRAALFRSASFRRGKGNRLLVVWTDGLPRTGDPATPATLTLRGLAAYTAVASDPLRGKEQKLVTCRNNGALVIRSLLVRDYPIFIQLTRR